MRPEAIEPGTAYDYDWSSQVDPQNTSQPQQPQQQKPPCKQDPNGGDIPDVTDFLGRTGRTGISNIRRSREGVRFDIADRQAFVSAMDADPHFRHRTIFNGDHNGQVGASFFNPALDYRSFTDQDGLGADSHGWNRSLQVVVGRKNSTGGAIGYADLDCDNPAEDVVGGIRHFLFGKLHL